MVKYYIKLIGKEVIQIAYFTIQNEYLILQQGWTFDEKSYVFDIAQMDEISIEEFQAWCKILDIGQKPEVLGIPLCLN